MTVLEQLTCCVLRTLRKASGIPNVSRTRRRYQISHWPPATVCRRRHIVPHYHRSSCFSLSVSPSSPCTSVVEEASERERERASKLSERNGRSSHALMTETHTRALEAQVHTVRTDMAIHVNHPLLPQPPSPPQSSSSSSDDAWWRCLSCSPFPCNFLLPSLPLSNVSFS